MIQYHIALADFLSRTRPALPLMLRLSFAATLAGYFWKSAATKLLHREGGGFDALGLEPSAYAQIFPKAFEAVNYDAGRLTLLHDLVAWGGTLTEVALPLMIVIGLATRVAALGMAGFVVVQTATDVVGHGAAPGALFDLRYALLDERALWIVLLLTLAISGAGWLSLDRRLGLDR